MVTVYTLQLYTSSITSHLGSPSTCSPWTWENTPRPRSIKITATCRWNSSILVLLRLLLRRVELLRSSWCNYDYFRWQVTAEISNLLKVYSLKVYSCSREKEVIKRWTEESIGSEHVVYVMPCSCLIWFDGSNLSHESCTSQTCGGWSNLTNLFILNDTQIVYIKVWTQSFFKKSIFAGIRVRTKKKLSHRHFFRPALLKPHSRLWIWWGGSWSFYFAGKKNDQLYPIHVRDHGRIHLWLPHWEPSIILLLRSSRVTWSVMVLNGVLFMMCFLV